VQQKVLTDKIAVYVPQREQGQQLVERLMKVAARKDRSINYLVIEALKQYLEREEHAEQD